MIMNKNRIEINICLIIRLIIMNNYVLINACIVYYLKIYNKLN